MSDSLRFSLLHDFVRIMAAPTNDAEDDPPSPVLVLEPPLPDLRAMIASGNGGHFLVPRQLLSAVKRWNSRRRLLERLSGLDLGI